MCYEALFKKISYQVVWNYLDEFPPPKKNNNNKTPH